MERTATEDNNLLKEYPDSGINEIIPPKRWGKRHTQVALAALSLGLVFNMKTNLNVAIVAMTDIKGNNTSEVYDWDKKTQNLVMSLFFLGYTVMMVPFGIISTKYGSKLPIVVAFFSCSAISFAFPLTVKIGGWKAACVCRVLLGMMVAAISPSLGTMMGRWIPLIERGRLMAFAQSGGQAGKVVGMATSGWLASTSIGWPLIFYVTGCFSFFTALLFLWLGSSSPDLHQTISNEEYRFIEVSCGINSHKKTTETPWKCIFTNIPVLAIMVAAVGAAWSLNTVMIESPSYMKNILRQDVKSSGLLSSLPFIAMGSSSIALSSFLDYLIKKKILSVTAARKLSSTIGSWVAGLLFVAFAFVPAEEVTWSIITLVSCVACMSGLNSGFVVMSLDVAPNFSGIIASIMTTAGNLLGFVAPLVSGFIINDVTSISQWRIVFIISAGIMFLSNLVLLIFGTSDVQPWNKPQQKIEEDKIFNN